jgi:hypothetical protein
MTLVRTPLAVLGSLLAAAAATAADPPPAPPAAVQTAQRALTLDLDRLFGIDLERGHAEFDGSLRRAIWRDDPMVRLAVAVDREQAAARRGGLVGLPPPFSSTTLLVTMPGPDPRLVFSGPWAADWHDLSTQEKIGRIAEGAAYAGLIVGILHALR